MTIKKGSYGHNVNKLQVMLSTLGFYDGAVDGMFGKMTEAAVKGYQKHVGLVADGVVGPKTNSALFGITEPPFSPLSGYERERIFGKFSYVPSPAPDNSGAPINILGDWESENIRLVKVPQLVGVQGFPVSGMVRMHKKMEQAFLGFMKDAAADGTLRLVKSWDGLFYPRYVRGSRSSLSNHSWGTAFDVNAGTNPIGHSNDELADLAQTGYKWGFFWGNAFANRPDPMHFEWTGKIQE